MNGSQHFHRKAKRRAEGRNPWTKEQDLILIHSKTHGNQSWREISDLLHRKRTPKQCRERWHNQINPEINHSDWTKDDVKKLWEGHKKYQNRWAQLARLFPGRTANAVKNMCNSLKRKIQLRAATAMASNHLLPSKAILRQRPHQPSVNTAGESSTKADAGPGVFRLPPLIPIVPDVNRMLDPYTNDNLFMRPLSWTRKSLLVEPRRLSFLEPSPSQQPCSSRLDELRPGYLNLPDSRPPSPGNHAEGHFDRRSDGSATPEGEDMHDRGGSEIDGLSPFNASDAASSLLDLDELLEPDESFMHSKLSSIELSDTSFQGSSASREGRNRDKSLSDDLQPGALLQGLLSSPSMVSESPQSVPSGSAGTGGERTLARTPPL